MTDWEMPEVNNMKIKSITIIPAIPVPATEGANTLYVNGSNWNKMKEQIEEHNKILAGGVEVVGECKHDFFNESYYTYTTQKFTGKQYKALLINIQTIKKDTAESLMNEMLEASKKTPLGSQFPSMQHYLERYKTVLEKE